MEQRINPRLWQELKKWDREVSEEQIVLLFATNLDPDIPQKKVKSLVMMGTEELRVYTDGEITHRVAAQDVAEMKMISGVGCVFVEYERKSDGEHVLFARADGRYSASVAQNVKRINHYLRSGAMDFSRVTAPLGRLCPKCGKPYPRGTQVCPRCSPKRKQLVRLLKLGLPEWKLIAISALLFLLTTAISLINPYIHRVLVDDYIQAPAENVFWIGFVGVILAMLGTNLLRRLIGVARGYFLTIAGNRLIVRLRDMVFEKIQRLSIAKISKRTSGELMKRVSSDTRTIKQFLINQFPNLLEQTLVLIGVSVVLFFYEWKLALLILLPAPFVALAFKLFWRFMRGMFHRRWELNSRANAILHDIFSGIRVVKAYGMEKREEERFVEISEKERDAQLRQERLH